MRVFGENSAGLIRILIEEFGREQSVADDVPSRGVTDVIEDDVIRVKAELTFVARRDRMSQHRIDAMRDEDVRVEIVQVAVVQYTRHRCRTRYPGIRQRRAP